MKTLLAAVANKVYPDGDMTPRHEVKIDQPGLYPFVSHSFASVDVGQVGLLKVGNVPGTMSH
jgi:hypothetical protein